MPGPVVGLLLDRAIAGRTWRRAGPWAKEARSSRWAPGGWHLLGLAGAGIEADPRPNSAAASIDSAVAAIAAAAVVVPVPAAAVLLLLVAAAAAVGAMPIAGVLAKALSPVPRA